MAKLSGALISKAKIKSKELEQILERRVEKRRQEQQEGSSRLAKRLSQIIGCKTEDQASQLFQDLAASAST